ncbi:MAG: hypothetical protein WA869_00850, partial [Alloacidobacterium sp.]
HRHLVSRLQKHLKGKSLECNYGLCAKAINLFLRDVVTNHYLRTHYKLNSLDKVLHIPLDSIVAKRLRELDRSLPPWDGLKHLSEGQYNQYQERAYKEATHRNMRRIHLDDSFFGNA